MIIDCSTYTLEKHEELSGTCAVWKNDSYLIAPPAFDDIAVPVQNIDCNNELIGEDVYYPEVDSFERYCKVIKS